MYTYELKSLLVGYLDDTTWFANSLANLSALLSASKPFYEFIEMKVNFHKFRILSNIADLHNKEIPIDISNQQINIRCLTSNEIQRFLGIYIHSGKSNAPIIKKLTSLAFMHFF